MHGPSVIFFLFLLTKFSVERWSADDMWLLCVLKCIIVVFSSGEGNETFYRSFTLNIDHAAKKRRWVSLTSIVRVFNRGTVVGILMVTRISLLDFFRRHWLVLANVHNRVNQLLMMFNYSITNLKQSNDIFGVKSFICYFLFVTDCSDCFPIARQHSWNWTIDIKISIYWYVIQVK